MTDAKLVPNRQELGSRVHLEILGRVEPGDVFYLVTNPEQVWYRDEDALDYSDPSEFCGLANETWYTMDRVGDGRPEQLTVVLHNTRNPLPRRGDVLV